MFHPESKVLNLEGFVNGYAQWPEPHNCTVYGPERKAQGAWVPTKHRLEGRVDLQGREVKCFLQFGEQWQLRNAASGKSAFHIKLLPQFPPPRLTDDWQNMPPQWMPVTLDGCPWSQIYKACGIKEPVNTDEYGPSGPERQMYQGPAEKLARMKGSGSLTRVVEHAKECPEESTSIVTYADVSYQHTGIDWQMAFNAAYSEYADAT
jgi:hypothetical protein